VGPVIGSVTWWVRDERIVGVRGRAEDRVTIDADQGLDWGSVSVYRDVVGTAQRRLLPPAGAGSLSVPAAGLPTVQALTTR